MVLLVLDRLGGLLVVGCCCASNTSAASIEYVGPDLDLQLTTPPATHTEEDETHDPTIWYEMVIDVLSLQLLLRGARGHDAHRCAS